MLKQDLAHTKTGMVLEGKSRAHLWQLRHEVISRLCVCKLRRYQALHSDLLHIYCQPTLSTQYDHLAGYVSACIFTSCMSVVFLRTLLQTSLLHVYKMYFKACKQHLCFLTFCQSGTGCFECMFARLSRWLVIIMSRAAIHGMMALF